MHYKLFIFILFVAGGVLLCHGAMCQRTIYLIHYPMHYGNNIDPIDGGIEEDFFGLQMPGGAIVSPRGLHFNLRNPTGMVLHNVPDTLRMAVRFVRTFNFNQRLSGKGPYPCHFDTSFILPISPTGSDTLVLHKQHDGARFWLDYYAAQYLVPRLQKRLKRIKWLVEYDAATGEASGKRIYGNGSLDLFFDSNLRCHLRGRRGRALR